MIRQTTLLRLITPALTGIGGLAAALAYASQFLGLWTQSTTRQLLTLGYLTAFFGLIAFGAWRRVLRPRWLTFAPAGRRAWLIGASLCAAWLVIAIPISPRLPPSRHTLDIIATGQRNPAARGSEVWLQRLERSDGLPLPLTDLQPQGDWEMRDNVWLSYQNQPATLRWQGALEGHLRLILTAHPWSGLVRVIWDGQERMVDLYDPVGTTREITLAVAPPPSGLTPLALSLYVAWTVALAGLLLGVGLVLSTWRGRGGGPVRLSRWAWLGYAAPCIVVWTVWLLAFWPGFMSPDSIHAWKQMVSGRYDNVHSILYTLTIWLATRLWLTPASMAFLQILVMSILIGLGVAKLRRIGVSAPFAWSIVLVLTASPLIATLTITLWKDIAYGATLLLLTLIIIDIVVSQGNWLTRRSVWLSLAILTGLAALYRHNGVMTSIGTMMVLLVVYHRQWRALVRSLVVFVGILLGVQGILYSAIDVRTYPWATLQPIIFQVAAHVSAGTELRSDEQRYLISLREMSDGWGYDCHSILPTLFDTGSNRRFNLAAVDQTPWSLVSVWWSLTGRAPWVNVQHIVCNSSLVWQVTQPPEACLHTNSLWIDKAGSIRTIEPNDVGLQEDSQLPWLQRLLADLSLRTRADDLSWLVWRPAFYLYLASGAMTVVAIRCRSWQPLLALLPIGLNTASLILAATDCDSRFHYPVFVLTPLLLGWLAVPCGDFSHPAVVAKQMGSPVEPSGGASIPQSERD
jgi:hypothetical protein